MENICKKGKNMKVMVVSPHPDDETLGAGGTLLRLKKEGHQVGRGQGQRNKQLNAKCVAKHKYIEGQMAKGISVPQIAKKLKIARGTLYRYLAYTGLRTPTKSRNGRWERGIY